MPRIQAVIDPQTDLRPSSVRSVEDLMQRVRNLEREEKNLIVPYNQQFNISSPIHPSRDFGDGWQLGVFDPVSPNSFGSTLLPSDTFLPLDRNCTGYAINAIHEFEIKHCTTLNVNRFNTDYSANNQFYSQLGSYTYQTGSYTVPLWLQFISFPEGSNSFNPLVQIPIGDLTFTPFVAADGNWQGIWNFVSSCSNLDMINDNIDVARSGFGSLVDWTVDEDKFTLQQVQSWLDGSIGSIGVHVVADVSAIQPQSGVNFTDEYYHFAKTLGLNIALTGAPEYTEPLISMSTSVLVTYRGIQTNIARTSTI